MLVGYFVGSREPKSWRRYAHSPATTQAAGAC
jgi:hypothetical protein